MKHVIVIPYYSKKEIKIFVEIARLWNELTETKVPYEFLLVARYDVAPSKVLEEEFSKIAAVRSIRSQAKGNGIGSTKAGFDIEGPTAMFWDAMEYVDNCYSKDGGFVLWFESDMVPVTPLWMNKLDEEWSKGDWVVMGRLIDMDWIKKFHLGGVSDDIPEHINGGACYCKDYCEKISREKTNLKNSWDAETFSQIKTEFPYMATDLIELRYKCITMVRPPNNETVLLHGVKDSSAIRFVRKANKLAKTRTLIYSHICDVVMFPFRVLCSLAKNIIKK